MENGAYIRDIKIKCDSSSASHETLDDLRCDICKKKSRSVLVLKPKHGDEIVFACSSKCISKAIEEMFIKYDDDYLWTCRIEDIRYADKKTTKKKVRSEMTLKLRYKVMKRDNFKCVLCGGSMPEVELRVDHIIPVCQGGTSVESNLRTLCFPCNSGKSGE